MYILSPSTYPYSVAQLRRDNPQTSFPRSPTDELLAAFNVFPVKPTDQPAFDPMTQRLEESTPVLHGGEWSQVWDVVELTADEQAAALAARTERVRQLRQRAYREESDPLFFKAQRGEATMDQWREKVDEIKARYPE